MNQLSWILYWADVIPRLSTALCVAAFILFIPTVIAWFLGFIDFFGDAYYEEDGTPRNDLARQAVRLRKLLWAVILLPLLWLASFMVPGNSETYYAIAASEMGEEVLKTPEMGKARQALNAWLDKQISDTEKTVEEATE